MTTTPEDYFLKTWKIVDGGGTDVRQGQILKIEKAGSELRLGFPEGADRFGDGGWGQFERLEYLADRGILCSYYTHKEHGKVTAEFSKFSTRGIRCWVAPYLGPGMPFEDPGEWTAEEEGGPIPA